MKTLTIEIKFGNGEALGDALQEIIDSIGCGNSSGKIIIDNEYVYEWSIKS